MKQVHCYNCDSTESRFYAAENGFTLVKCDGCGLLYVNPRPEDGDIEQSHTIGEHRGKMTIAMTGRFKDSAIHRFTTVLKDLYDFETSLDGKRWLDIGAGHGEFLAALQQYSRGTVIAKGLEPNVRKQKSARRRNLAVSFFDLDHHDSRYDVISLLNVYSHLPDPPAAIASWKRLLADGGELLLETGDTADLASKDQVRPFYLPDHLSFSSERIIVQMLDELGFDIIQVKKYPAFVPSLSLLAKEIIKIVWPKKQSRIRSLLKHRLYSTSDMFIRAKLRK